MIDTFAAQSKIAISLQETLANRLFDELRHLNAPQHVFELAFGLEFMSLYTTGQHQPEMQQDFPAMLNSSMHAIAESGGL